MPLALGTCCPQASNAGALKPIKLKPLERFDGKSIMSVNQLGPEADQHLLIY